MTKFSKILAVLVTAFSILFMGIAAVMSTAQTDWKSKATKEFPKSRITDPVNGQQAQIANLSKEIETLDKQQKDAEAGIAADSLAITTPDTGRVALLEAEVAQLIDESRKVADQVEAEAKKVGGKQDEDKRLREEVTRLKSQFDDLVAQKEDALANVKRLRDLLFQATGVLDRVKKRRESLDSERSRPYDPDPSTAARPASRRPENLLK
jgi:chromosome segregation ATPase